MSDNTPKVVVNIEQNTRIYKIIATLLVCGAVVMVAHAMNENGWSEIAATMVTVFGVQMTTLLVKNGIIGLPEKQTNADFQGTKGLLRTMAADYREWQARSTILRLILLAAAYMIVFMSLRWAASMGLNVFTNIWVAGAAGALLASIIIFPSLFVDAAKSLRTAGVAAKARQDEKNDALRKQEEREIHTTEFDLSQEPENGRYKGRKVEQDSAADPAPEEGGQR